MAGTFDPQAALGAWQFVRTHRHPSTRRATSGIYFSGRGKPPYQFSGFCEEILGTYLHDRLLRARFLTRVLLHALHRRRGGNDECEGNFAAVLVRESDNADVGYVRVVEEVALELGGGNCVIVGVRVTR